MPSKAEIEKGEMNRGWTGRVIVPKKFEGRGFGFVKFEGCRCGLNDVLGGLGEEHKQLLTKQLSEGKGVFVHETRVGGLEDGLRMGVEVIVERIEFNPEKKKFFVARANTREAWQKEREERESEILDIRVVERGKKGSLVLERGMDEKVIIWDRKFPIFEEGTPVAVTHFEEKDRVRIARGFSLADRMVVKEIYSVRMGFPRLKSLVGGNIRTSFWLPREWTEFRTAKQDHRGYSRGSVTGYDLWYLLVKPEKEEVVRKLFIWNRFMDIVYGKLGLSDMLNQYIQSRNAAGVNWKSFSLEQIRQDWRFDPEAERYRIMWGPGNPNGGLPGNMLNFEVLAQKIIDDYLALTLFLYARRETSSFRVEEILDNVLEKKVARKLFESLLDKDSWQEMDKQWVVNFLAANSDEIEIDLNNRNGNIFGLSEVEASAWYWVPGKEAKELASEVNKYWNTYPKAVRRGFTDREVLYERYVELGRKPRIEDFVDMRVIEMDYPSRIKILGIGECRIKYKPTRKDHLAELIFERGNDIGDWKEQLWWERRMVMRIRRLPELPAGASGFEIVYKVVKNENDLTELKKSLRERFWQEQLKATLRSDGEKREEVIWNEEIGIDNIESIPNGIPAKELGEDKDFGRGRVLPKHVLVTRKGLRFVGVIGEWDEEAIKKVRDEWELVVKLWKARLGEKELIFCDNGEEKRPMRLKSGIALVCNDQVDDPFKVFPRIDERKYVYWSESRGYVFDGNMIKSMDHGPYGPKITLKATPETFKRLNELELFLWGVKDLIGEERMRELQEVFDNTRKTLLTEFSDLT